MLQLEVTIKTVISVNPDYYQSNHPAHIEEVTRQQIIDKDIFADDLFEMGEPEVKVVALNV